jgi:hypothetical protein
MYHNLICSSNLITLACNFGFCSAGKISSSLIKSGNFWITLSNGKLCVGEGISLGENEIASATVSPLSCTKLHWGFAGWSVPVTFTNVEVALGLA